MRLPLFCLFAAFLGVAEGQRAYPFYPGRENEARQEPFETRKARMPTGWETPAWKAFTYVAENPRSAVIYDRGFVAESDRNRRALFRELDVKLAKDRSEDELRVKVLEWSTIFQTLREELSDALEAKGLHMDPAKQVIVEKFSMAVPALANTLYKSLSLFEGIRCLTHLPRDIAMAISAPDTFDDYVALRGFLSLIPEFASTLPREYPFKIVVHHDPHYRQWGNRWMAANYTSPQAEWVAFWDNDDFPAPSRYRWYDQIFTAHPELDVFLAGKWYSKQESFQDVVNYTVAHLLITNESDFAKAKEAHKDMTDQQLEDHLLEVALMYEPDRGYNEPMTTMNSTWLSKWRVGSIIGAPLFVGRQYFIQDLYEATYEALNHTERYTEDQINLIRSELDFLGLVEKRTGLDWGDFWVQDGWSTIRREILTLINPPTRATWGEDSLYNWMIAASGFNYFHMTPPFFHLRSGVYCRWPHPETFWKLPSSNATQTTTTHPTMTQTTTTQPTMTQTTTTHPTMTQTTTTQPTMTQTTTTQPTMTQTTMTQSTEKISPAQDRLTHPNLRRG